MIDIKLPLDKGLISCPSSSLTQRLLIERLANIDSVDDRNTNEGHQISYQIIFLGIL